jgi:DnaJ-class molecular chaperone
MPKVGEKGKGDLFVVVEVRTPRDVSDRERALLLELAKLQSCEDVKKPGSPMP